MAIAVSLNRHRLVSGLEQPHIKSHSLVYSIVYMASPVIVWKDILSFS